MSEHRAANQEIRPMEVAILNLMPNKIETEVQILRMLANTPLQINVDFVRIHANESKNTPKEHLENFYRLFDDIKDNATDLKDTAIDTATETSKEASKTVPAK
jgi:homoserine O-succinyltransferase